MSNPSNLTAQEGLQDTWILDKAPYSTLIQQKLSPDSIAIDFTPPRYHSTFHQNVTLQSNLAHRCWLYRFVPSPTSPVSIGSQYLRPVFYSVCQLPTMLCPSEMVDSHHTLLPGSCYRKSEVPPRQAILSGNICLREWHTWYPRVRVSLGLHRALSPL